MLIAAGVLAPRSALAAPADAGAPFGMLELLDEVEVGDPADPHEYVEDPAGGATVTEIMGQPARVLVPDHDAKMFGYRIGVGVGLVPGRAYLLVVEYPDDAPRTIAVVNRGADLKRTFATGTALGDAREQYAYSNPESLHYPHTGQWQQFRQFFVLSERFTDLAGVRNPEEVDRPWAPEDGFWVGIGQFRDIGNPLEAGAAVARIRLFEVGDPEAFALTINHPPEPLPRRHVFWREEMADNDTIWPAQPEDRAFADRLDWFATKIHTARFLGFDTLGKDLLEFGHNQGWDSEPHGGSAWFNASAEPGLWAGILDLAAEAGLSVLPYYEYRGAIGQGSGGVPSLAIAHRCRPLGDRPSDYYTGFAWAEQYCVDITDPDALTDVLMLLDATIYRYVDVVPFVGAWFRTRLSAWPISFTDATLGRFATEANDAVPVTRDQLRADGELLARYYDWWLGRRQQFLEAIRDDLRAHGVPEGEILLTSYHEEGLRAAIPDWRVVTDDVDPWAQINATPPWQWRYEPMTSEQWLAEGRFAKTQLELVPPTAEELASGAEEWQHGTPPADPDRYAEADGVYLTLPFSRQYTVADQSLLDRFHAAGGLAMIRHYSLNEDDGHDSDEVGLPQPMDGKLGYFVSDVDRAGAHATLAEARAVARGDVRYLGYLSSSSFSSGFPEEVRSFNAAFLALPALPSTVVDGAASDPEIVVRRIDTDGMGTYFAIANTSMDAKLGVAITLPVEGTPIDLVVGGEVTGAVDLRSGGLLAWRVGGADDGGDDGADGTSDAGEGSADASAGDDATAGDATDAATESGDGSGDPAADGGEGQGCACRVAAPRAIDVAAFAFVAPLVLLGGRARRRARGSS